jgi:negative regulator of flagellin synthesis FlgM
MGPVKGPNQGPNVAKTLATDVASLASTAAPEQSRKSEKNSAKNAATGATDNNYNVDVSGKGQDIARARQKALDIARNTPDVRENRVAELKAKIASGEYQIDSGGIADGMMREAILEHLAETDR